MLLCQQCKKPSWPLILGLCQKCAPEIHERWHELYTAANTLCDEYEAETGIKALSNWAAFEAWCDIESCSCDVKERARGKQ